MLPFQIRPAQPADVPAIFSLIQALAAYECLTDHVSGSFEQLQEHLFGSRVSAEVLLAEVPEETAPVGFALFFQNYSTFLTQPGLYLEDLFVQPAYRGRGIGRAFLVKLANLAVERNYGRLEWAVLDWNEPAITFYQRMGAKSLPEWILNRVTGEDLLRLAQVTLESDRSD
jgi:GNAT superfamily N-acetyltransferase